MPHKRVLLIEDDLDYSEIIETVLAACGEMFEVRSASSLEAGLQLVEEYVPEVILVDLNLPDSSGYQTFLRVREFAPATPVVVLTGLDDDQVAIRAVEDGAQDYLVKSLIQPKIIARCVHMALSRQHRQATHSERPSGSARVLSFIGSKGGVGTSTTAVNIAALLAQNALDTLLIELQPGRRGTLSLYLQTDSAHGLNWLLNKPGGTITAADLKHCLVQAQPRLHVLCSNSSAGASRSLDASQAEAMIGVARRMGQVVVLDLPPCVDEGTAAALRLSDSITVIVDRESSSIHCAPALLEQIRLATSPGKEVRLALTDRTGLESEFTNQDIQRQLKMYPLAMIPAAGVEIALSHTARIPLVLLYPDDAFSSAHFELAEYLVPEAVNASHPAARSGWKLSRKVSWGAIPETRYS